MEIAGDGAADDGGLASPQAIVLEGRGRAADPRQVVSHIPECRSQSRPLRTVISGTIH